VKRGLFSCFHQPTVHAVYSSQDFFVVTAQQQVSMTANCICISIGRAKLICRSISLNQMLACGGMSYCYTQIHIAEPNAGIWRHELLLLGGSHCIPAVNTCRLMERLGQLELRGTEVASVLRVVLHRPKNQIRPVILTSRFSPPSTSAAAVSFVVLRLIR